jgi:galactan 5-O-arabinofuranosyltransferase
LTVEQTQPLSSVVAPEPPRPARPGRGARWLPVAEGVVAVAVALLTAALARSIDVNPLDRIGQVSGMSALQLRYALVAIVLLTAIVIAARAGGRRIVEHLTAAATAGLFTGLIAGALVVALRGTSYGLNGEGGDTGVLIQFARDLMTTGKAEPSYPPGFVHLMAWYSEWTGTPPEYAIKALQIGMTALFGPVAYLAWRLLLPPLWALGLGIVPAIPLVDPYKPYTNLMLVVFIPVLLVLLRHLRMAGHTPWRKLVPVGIALGAALGVIFLIYSGWFVWSAPGVAVAALVLFPWRHNPLRGLALIGISTAVFVVVSSYHLFGLLDASGSVKDRYYYWDTWIEPAYFAMWKGDLPGSEVGAWPPPGELGGVGVFMLLAILGLAVAIAVARSRTVVITLTCLFAGSWLLRFHFASQMYAQDAVQLYPRTTAQLLYCLLLLTGFAGYYTVHRLRRTERVAKALASPSVPIAVLAALLLLLAGASSSIGDRYFPRSDNSIGLLATVAQLTKLTDGSCPAYANQLGTGCFPRRSPELLEAVRKLVDQGPRPGMLPHPPTSHEPPPPRPSR